MTTHYSQLTTHYSLLTYSLESCVTSLEQAHHAEHHGAHRLEVCARIETEGMTPDVDLVSEILRTVKIPVRVMIRENEVGFETDDILFEKMILSINEFKQLPINGFAIGVLKNKCVDRNAMEILIEACHPFPITFHKAIDQSVDKLDDLIWLNDQTSIDTILTSGGAQCALDGIHEIIIMKSLFRGDVMAGGKITQDQLSTLHSHLQLKWYHGRSIV